LGHTIADLKSQLEFKGSELKTLLMDLKDAEDQYTKQGNVILQFQNALHEMEQRKAEDSRHMKEVLFVRYKLVHFVA
jgi:hypothetical protein